MSRKEFLRNVDKAAWFLSPTYPTNGIRLDEEHVAELLGRSTRWLTRDAVEGFDRRDFRDLSRPERERLARNVETFRKLAQKASEAQSATADQVQEAIPVFRSILMAVSPFLEGFRVYAALMKEPFPEFVHSFAVRERDDWSGDPSAKIWVIVEDEEIGKEDFHSKTYEIEKRIEKALDRAGIELLVYVLYRSVSDQLELEQELERELAR